MATIPSLKQAFLAAQTQLLTQPLAPSRSWVNSNHASEAPIPERFINEALASINHTVLQHCRRVYAPLASRNVAEQIGELYGREDEGEDEGIEGEGIGRGVDLTQEKIIQELPDSWPEKEAHAHPAEAHRYRTMVAQLKELSEQRRSLILRVERLRRLQVAIESLGTEEGGAGVQENLATRGGAVEKELERMRILMARVAGRVEGLVSGGVGEGRGVGIEGLGEGRRRAVEEFLEGRAFRD